MRLYFISRLRETWCGTSGRNSLISAFVRRHTWTMLRSTRGYTWHSIHNLHFSHHVWKIPGFYWVHLCAWLSKCSKPLLFCAILQYQMDTEQLSETLTKLNNSLDPKNVSNKSNSETLLQLEVHKRICVVSVTETEPKENTGKLALRFKCARYCKMMWKKT